MTPRVRKTLFMSFRKCPKQGMYMSRDRDNESYGDVNWEVPALANGQLFHHAAEDFWNSMYNDEEMVDWNKEVIEENFVKLMPKTNSVLNDWFNWYAGYEANRYYVLRGLGEERFFRPFKMENAVEADIGGLIRTGHFDRVDRVSDKELIIVEYKTGFSYDPEKSYAVTNVRSELMWYKSILDNMEEYKDYKIVGWRMINPTVKRVIDGKFSPLTKHAVDKTADLILKWLNGDEEAKKKYGPYCQFCEWMEECIGYKVDGHEIFGLMEADENE